MKKIVISQKTPTAKMTGGKECVQIVSRIFTINLISIWAVADSEPLKWSIRTTMGSIPSIPPWICSGEPVGQTPPAQIKVRYLLLK